MSTMFGFDKKMVDNPFILSSTDLNYMLRSSAKTLARLQEIDANQQTACGRTLSIRGSREKSSSLI